MTPAEALTRMESLTEDWHSCGASPPNSTAIALAREVVAACEAQGVAPSYLTPSTGESVMVVFERGWRYADIECFNTGDVLAITSGPPGREIWDVVSVADAVSRIAAYIWHEKHESL
jgi:hypothetical protein